MGFRIHNLNLVDLIFHNTYELIALCVSCSVHLLWGRLGRILWCKFISFRKMIDNAKGENDVLKIRYKLGNGKRVELSSKDVLIPPTPIGISKVELPLSDSALIKTRKFHRGGLLTFLCPLDLIPII